MDGNHRNANFQAIPSIIKRPKPPDLFRAVVKWAAFGTPPFVLQYFIPFFSDTWPYFSLGLLFVGLLAEFVQLHREAQDSTWQMAENAAQTITDQTNQLKRNFQQASDGLALSIESLREEFGKLSDRIDDKLYLGPRGTVLPELLKELGRAERVLNTLVLFNLDDARSSDEYRKDLVDHTHQAIELFLRANVANRWTDLVSWETLAHERLDWRSFSSRLTASSDLKDQYMVHVTKEAYPIVNFTIVYYRIGKGAARPKPKVLFGWGHHSHDQGSPVFSSSDENLVSYFERYWDCLFQQDSRQRDARSNELYWGQESTLGQWVVVSTAKSVVREAFLLEKSQGEDGRQIILEGSVHDPQSGQSIGSARSKATALANGALWCFLQKRLRSESGSWNESFDVLQLEYGTANICTGSYHYPAAGEPPFFLQGRRLSPDEWKKYRKASPNARHEIALDFINSLGRSQHAVTGF